MAFRRMFNGQKIETDQFLDLDPRVQALYFHLILNADDDGFVAKPKAILRMCGCNIADLEALLQEDYLIRFPSGVIVIKAWKMHNFIRKDRYHPSIQPERDLICWDNRGEYLLIEDVEDAYDPDTGEIGYPEGYIHYFDEDEKEEAKAEDPKPASPAASDEGPSSEAPAADEPAEPDDYDSDDDDFPDDPEDSSSLSQAGLEDTSSLPPASPAAPSSLSALRSSLSPGSHLVANRVPEVRLGKSKSYSYAKKSLRSHCDRRVLPHNCSSVIGESDSVLSKASTVICRKGVICDGTGERRTSQERASAYAGSR